MSLIRKMLKEKDHQSKNKSVENESQDVGVNIQVLNHCISLANISSIFYGFVEGRIQLVNKLVSSNNKSKIKDNN